MSLQNITIQEEERERIAIKLHDEIGSKLNILYVWLNNPETWNSERSRKIIIAQVSDLIETTRCISHYLYPANLERFGLIHTLQDLIGNVESSLQIQFVFTHNYTFKNISIEIHLYRIIQEFLSNVLKHSQANKMLMHIRHSNNSLSIILADNGKGFNYPTKTKGIGLKNIELRLKSIKANYKWKNIVNKGCCLIIIISNHE